MAPSLPGSSVSIRYAQGLLASDYQVRTLPPFPFLAPRPFKMTPSQSIQLSPVPSSHPPSYRTDAARGARDDRLRSFLSSWHSVIVVSERQTALFVMGCAARRRRMGMRNTASLTLSARAHLSLPLRDNVLRISIADWY